MAAPPGKMETVRNESSSSEDEDLQKFKEAVWDTANAKPKDGETNGQSSRRLVVSEHKHDGNELQVTPEFRSHVAKKLEHMLDSYITEMPGETSSHTQSQCDEKDDGFRLFATSVPGQKSGEPSRPVRRRIPSSSDSDSDMEARLKEAAVSVSDLLPPSSLPSASTTTPCSVEMNNKKQEGETSLSKKKKKKKKRKAPQDESEELVCSEQRPEAEEGNPVPKKKKQSLKESAGTTDEAQNEGENGALQRGIVQLNSKLKKKKKQKAVD